MIHLLSFLAGTRHSIDVGSLGSAEAAGMPGVQKGTLFAHSRAGKNSKDYSVGLTFVRASRSMDVGRAVPGSSAGQPGQAGWASDEHCVQRSLLDDLMAPVMSQSISEALTASAQHDGSTEG